MTLLIALAGAAFAGGFYHPGDVAAKSALYVEASSQASTKVTELQERASRLAGALAAYEEALDLLGPHAPAEERERLDALTTTYNRELATLQVFAETMIEDFDTEFSSALDRALAKRPGEEQVCQAMIATGRPVPGIPQRPKPNPDCKGEDLNAALGAAMDADGRLRKAVEEILALEWPDLGLDAQPAAPLMLTGDAKQGLTASPADGEPRYVDVDVFFRRLVPANLRAIARQDDDARLEFEAAIEQGADAEQLQGFVEQARRITEQTARRRAELAEPLLTTAHVRLGKAGTTVAWCAQPPALGGCRGTDATAEVLETLRADKKFLKVVP